MTHLNNSAPYPFRLNFEHGKISSLLTALAQHNLVMPCINTKRKQRLCYATADVPNKTVLYIDAVTSLNFCHHWSWSLRVRCGSQKKPSSSDTETLGRECISASTGFDIILD